jgi:choline-sulfatase
MRHILEMPAGKNFFLLHWMLDPHYPYAPVKKFAARIEVDESSLSLPRTVYSTKKLKRKNCSPADNKFLRDLYIAEVESVDERVGFIISSLMHKKLLDNTYIVFTSDHGEQFGEHGLFEHGGHGLGCHYYEGLLRVPLIMAGPDLPRGATIIQNISLLSLMPTLKQLLGVEYESDAQGRSFIHLVQAGAQTNGPLYFDDIRRHDQIDAVIEGEYKLICLENERYELYNLSLDPREEINYAGRQPDRVRSMFKFVKKMRAENDRRRELSRSMLKDMLDKQSDAETQKIIEQLKSLGYIN